MSEVLQVLLTLAIVAASVGALVGWLLMRNRSARQRAVSLLVVLLGFAVLLALYEALRAGSAATFAPLEFLVLAIAAAPVVVLAAGAGSCALWFQTSRGFVLVFSALAGAVASPAILFMVLVAGCALLGDCL